jgi:hypothetical protein
MLSTLQGDANGALRAAQRAVALAEPSHLRLEQGASLRVLGQVYEARGDREGAARRFRQSLQVLEAIQSRPELAQMRVAFAASGQAPEGRRGSTDRRTPGSPQAPEEVLEGGIAGRIEHRSGGADLGDAAVGDVGDAVDRALRQVDRTPAA